MLTENADLIRKATRKIFPVNQNISVSRGSPRATNKRKGEKENEAVFFKKVTFLEPNSIFVSLFFSSRASDTGQFGC